MQNRWGGRWSTRPLPKCRRTPGSSFPGTPRSRSSRRSATGRREVPSRAQRNNPSSGKLDCFVASLAMTCGCNMRSPLQNRVTPTGDIIATPHRGMFTGNRGIIHYPATKTLLSKRWASQAWITCLCEFRGWRRKVMGGRSWTELFFLDEATAFAAGHRPCFFCRRDDANRFRAAWAEGNAVASPRAREMDVVLHRERLDRGRKRLHPLTVPLSELPDGAMVQ